MRQAHDMYMYIHIYQGMQRCLPRILYLPESQGVAIKAGLLNLKVKNLTSHQSTGKPDFVNVVLRMHLLDRMTTEALCKGTGLVCCVTEERSCPNYDEEQITYDFGHS